MWKLLGLLIVYKSLVYYLVYVVYLYADYSLHLQEIITKLRRKPSEHALSINIRVSIIKGLVITTKNLSDIIFQNPMKKKLFLYKYYVYLYRYLLLICSI